MTEESKCPHCGGEILPEAKKCRHCGEWLDESAKQAAAAQPPGPPMAPGPPADAGPPPSNGVATAALVLGIIGILFNCLSIVALILGIIGLSKAGRHPSRPGHGAALAGLILGIVGLLFIPITAAIMIPSLLSAKTAANESMAIANCRMIGSQQEFHMARNNSYATLEQLAENGDIDPELAGGTKHGYRFTVEVGEEGYNWSITAMPVVPGGTGNRSFYMGTDTVIRGRPCTSASDPPADESSDPVM